MTQQPLTDLELFVKRFNEKRLSRVLDRAVDFYQDLVKHRTIESYVDVQKFAELHNQISLSLDEEGLSDDERTDIALLGISLSHHIESSSVNNEQSNFDNLSQAHKKFVTDVAMHPGVNHAKIFNHALFLYLDDEGVELLAQKSVANLPAESLGKVADGIDFRNQKAKLFVSSLIKEQANANKALVAENKDLRNVVQSALNGQNFSTQKLSEYVGRVRS
jgi:ribosome-binding factor A